MCVFVYSVSLWVSLFLVPRSLLGNPGSGQHDAVTQTAGACQAFIAGNQRRVPAESARPRIRSCRTARRCGAAHATRLLTAAPAMLRSVPATDRSCSCPPMPRALSGRGAGWSAHCGSGSCDSWQSPVHVCYMLSAVHQSIQSPARIRAARQSTMQQKQ